MSFQETAFQPVSFTQEPQPPMAAPLAFIPDFDGHLIVHKWWILGYLCFLSSRPRFADGFIDTAFERVL